MDEVVFALTLVLLWVLIASAMAALMGAAAWACSTVSLAAHRAVWRRSAMGYPPDGGPAKYVLTPAPAVTR